MQTTLTNLLSQIVAQAERATIRILGYPRLFKPDPFCVLVLGISTGEAKWIDQITLDWNNRTAQAVASIQALHPDVDIQYVDVDDYLNVGACNFHRSKRHLQDIVLTDAFGISMASFHPTLLGYDAYYQALLDSL
jgi:hypothetical protein